MFFMNINHGYKQWLFNRVLNEVNASERINDDSELVLSILNRYYDRLAQIGQTQTLKFRDFFKKLTKKADSVITEIEEVDDGLNFFANLQ